MKRKSHYEIAKIIEFIDGILTKRGIDYIRPVEANKLLDEAKLLNDREGKWSGLPLRKLLRDGKIPHAFQTGGKYSPWHIPLSKAKVKHTPMKKR